MRTVTLKTTDLTDCEIGKFLGAFREVYNQERSITYFKNEYTSTCLEHSFHTLLYNEFDEICGSYSLIPFIYSVKGEEVLVGLGSDLFIKDSYRDNVSNLLSVLNAAIKNAEEVGMVACFGFPNDNSEMVSRAFLKEKRIGLLDTYILPYKIGDYKASMKLLNPFSILFSNCLLGLSHLSSSNNIADTIIRKVRPQFEQTRFKWFNPTDYHLYQNNEMQCVWKISAFEGVKACFLMDVYPLTARNFDKAVRKMVCDVKKECGLFLYVGHLHFTPLSMVKIPRRFEPKAFRFDCRILDKEKLSKVDVFNIDNWEVDLSSYDLL